MQINLVEDGLSRRLNYDASKFVFGGVNLPAAADQSRLFRLPRAASAATGRTCSEFAIFQGASFFRSTAPGQNLGVTARGLSIRTGDSRGEEFPIFRAVWIEKATLRRQRPDDQRPARIRKASSAPIASRSIPATPPSSTSNARCSRAPRVDNFGLATMSATSLFSPLDRRGDDDVRDAGGGS